MSESILLSISEYSKPEKVVKQKLCTVYYLKQRLSKPGRELIVGYNNAIPLASGLKSNYIYLVRFFEKGNVAGNHYHKEKRELLIPVNGEMEVHLENVETKEREKIIINSKQPVAIDVPTGIAHAIKSTKEGDIFLVVASNQSNDEDEISYQVIK